MQHLTGKRASILAICLLGSMLVSCSPIVEVRGHVKDDEALAALKAGMSHEDVLNTLGSPSSVSTYGPETWYYMYSRKEHIGFMKPKIVEQQITEVEFDADGTVKTVQSYDKNNARKVTMVSRTTPTEGHSMGVLEQVLGNVGRFNKAPEAAKQ